ncbi:MAG: hypothetical protein ACREOG_22935 [Gemmatimonadaceae bacterium]
MQIKSVLRASIGALLVAAACRGQQEAASRDSAAAMSDSGAMKDMSGMQAGGMMGGMMEQMEAHLRMMDTASAATMQSMLAMHRQMAANMISTMNDEMRRMNMSANASWTATADSVRQDLIRMPEMSASELAAFMPAHRARMMRIMQMHRSMMGKG